MLFVEKLIQFQPEVKLSLERLFAKANANQSHENDLLLVIIHGHYDPVIASNKSLKLSPYLFGPGNEGLMHNGQFEFYDRFRRSNLVLGDRIKYLDYFRSTKDSHEEQSISTHMEMMLYLKFWESDLVLKQFYNLCRLIHGEPYNWHKKLENSRKKLIETEIKDKARSLVPEFFKILDECYVRQIRNAAAHSQFSVFGEHIQFYNFDPKAGHILKSMPLDTWMNLFHKVVLLQDELMRKLSEYELEYRKAAMELHFGRQLRIVNKSDTTKYTWLRLEDPSNVDSRWTWYDTYKRYYSSGIPRK